MEAERICAIEDVPQGSAREFSLAAGEEQRYLVVIRRANSVWVYENVCPHAGRPLNWAPDQFLFTPQGKLVCAAHGATFEVETGEAVGGPCIGSKLRSVPVAVSDGVIYAI